MILISIIVPVYNKEKYLDASLKSIVKQSYEKLEIIIINDGSTDNSENIIKKWELKDKRVKYIKQNNKGVANARNTGIEFAKGKYVYFIDADDYINLDTIEILVKNSYKIHSDIIVANNFQVRNNQIIKKISFKNRVLYPKDLKNGRTKAEMFLVGNRVLSSACNKLYKLSFLKNNKLKFISNVLAEDRLFNLMCYLHDPTIIITNDYTYYVNVIDDSRSRMFSTNFFNECINLIYELNNYLKEKKLVQENKDLLQIIALYDINNIFNYYYAHYNNIKGLSKSIKLIKSDKLIHSTLKKLNKEKTLKKITISNKDYYRYNLLLKFYLYLPKSMTSILYILFKKKDKVHIIV